MVARLARVQACFGGARSAAEAPCRLALAHRRIDLSGTESPLLRASGTWLSRARRGISWTAPQKGHGSSPRQRSRSARVPADEIGDAKIGRAIGSGQRPGRRAPSATPPDPRRARREHAARPLRRRGAGRRRGRLCRGLGRPHHGARRRRPGHLLQLLPLAAGPVRPPAAPARRDHARLDPGACRPGAARRRPRGRPDARLFPLPRGAPRILPHPLRGRDPGARRPRPAHGDHRRGPGSLAPAQPRPRRDARGLRAARPRAHRLRPAGGAGLSQHALRRGPRRPAWSVPDWVVEAYGKLVRHGLLREVPPAGDGDRTDD